MISAWVSYGTAAGLIGVLALIELLGKFH